MCIHHADYQLLQLQKSNFYLTRPIYPAKTTFSTVRGNLSHTYTYILTSLFPFILPNTIFSSNSESNCHVPFHPAEHHLLRIESLQMFASIFPFILPTIIFYRSCRCLLQCPIHVAYYHLQQLLWNLPPSSTVQFTLHILASRFP